MKKLLILLGLVSFFACALAAELNTNGGGAHAVVDGDKPDVSSSTENVFFTSWGYSTYTLSASPGGPYVFIDSETKISAGEPNGTNCTKKTITNTNTTPESFSLGLYGKMYKPGNNEGSPIGWSASINSKFFYIVSNQNNGAKNIIVPHGTSVLYTAYSDNSTQESTWDVTGFPSKDSDSIYFNKSWWLDLWPWAAPNISNPVPGIYDIKATSKDSAGGSDSGEMKVVGVASVSGHGKTSTREEIPSGTDKWTDAETIYAQPQSIVELTMTLNPSVTLDDTLKDSINWSVSGWLSTISPKESNKLEATFKPDSSGDYVVTASCGSSQRLIRIKVAAPKIYNVTFSGNITINKDTGGSYSGVAWQDDDLDGSSDLTNANADSSKKYHPIAYRSTSTMSASAVFKPNCRNSDDTDFISAYDVEADVKKVRFTPYSFWSWGNDWSTPIILNMGGTSVTAISAFNSSPKVGYDSSFELAWEVGFGEAGTADDSLSWERSYSEHELYLTYNAATSSYETVFHIGCTSANGDTSEGQIVSSIWNVFAGKNVTRKGDSVQFKYWNPASSTPQRLNLMLQDANANGSCIAWSQFFKEALNAQFASGAQIYEVTAISGTGFLVKSWLFGNYISPGANGILNSTATSDDIVDGNYIFPGPNGILDSSASGDDIIQDGFFRGTSSVYPYLVGYDVVDQEGVSGQGNSNPPGIFGNHFIVRYSGAYYDPSYGSGSFASSNAHENASIDGISAIISTYQVAKKKGSSSELSYAPTSL